MILELSIRDFKFEYYNTILYYNIQNTGPEIYKKF